jgi:hypothetical protein
MSARFWDHVRKTEGCWIWEGPTLPKGYGYFYDSKVQRGTIYAHRYALSLRTQLLPGDVACHSCDNPRCLRPSHLFVGTAADNIADMIAKGREGDTMPRKNARKTHCKRGHEFTPENTRLNTGRNGQQRQCITCDNERHREPNRNANATARTKGERAESEVTP